MTANVSGPDDEEDRDAEACEKAEREAEELEDGGLDPDELGVEPAWWDEGGDDEA